MVRVVKQSWLAFQGLELRTNLRLIFREKTKNLSCWNIPLCCKIGNIWLTWRYSQNTPLWMDQVYPCRWYFVNPVNEGKIGWLRISVRSITGLCFSRPKPVFPVQNGINWDKPVFPSFSRPKLGKTVQNWEKLYGTIFQAAKSFQKCVSNKNLTGQNRSSFHIIHNTVVMTYELIIQISWNLSFWILHHK